MAVETTTTSNENVPASATAPEATVSTESATPERKSRSPRGKAKSPAISTPPTRHSTRAKKPVSSSSTNEEEEKQTNEDTGAPTTSQNQTSPSPKRAKRQPTTPAKDDIQASNQPTSTTDEVNVSTDHDAVISDVEEGGETKEKTPSPRKGARGSTSGGRKRGASSSPSVSPAKKTKTTPKVKQSKSLNDEQQMDVDNAQGNEATATSVPTAATSESEPVQTPPKKARTSGNRKTPTSTTPESPGEYVRKLRPRK